MQCNPPEGSLKAKKMPLSSDPPVCITASFTINLYEINNSKTIHFYTKLAVCVLSLSPLLKYDHQVFLSVCVVECVRLWCVALHLGKLNCCSQGDSPTGHILDASFVIFLFAFTSWFRLYGLIQSVQNDPWYFVAVQFLRAISRYNYLKTC